MAVAYGRLRAAAIGTELHEVAHLLIKHKIRQPRARKTLNLYVNDAIGFKMKSEVGLFFSRNAFGTADTISFRDMFLRISDLKNGEREVGVRQLEIYAALFCLEYGYTPLELKGIELRIYQNDEVRLYEGDPVAILLIMDQIRTFDPIIESWRERDDA